MLQLASQKKLQEPHHGKAMELQKHISNISSRIFSEHRQCKQLPVHKCDTVKKVVPCLQLYGLYHKIKFAIRQFSAHSDSLLLNETNNPA